MGDFSVGLCRCSDFSDDESKSLFDKLPKMYKENLAKKNEGMKNSLLARYLVFFLIIQHTFDGQISVVSKQDITEKADALVLIMQKTPWDVSPLGKLFENGMKTEDGKVFISLSHSGNVAAAGISVHPLGIDAEADVEKRRKIPFERIYNRFKGKDETAEVSNAESFFRWWTAKEAVAKLDGRGLSMLSKICVCGDVFYTENKKGLILFCEKPIGENETAFVSLASYFEEGQCVDDNYKHGRFRR